MVARLHTRVQLYQPRGGGHSAQSSWGLADTGHVVSSVFTTILEKAAWHKDMNSEPKKLALHLIDCSAQDESLYFSQLLPRWGQDSLPSLPFPRGAAEVSWRH